MPIWGNHLIFAPRKRKVTMMKNRSLLLLGMMMAPCCMAQAQMNLGDCIREALANNIDLHILHLDVGSADIGIRQQKSKRIPTVGGIFQLQGYIDRPSNVTNGTLLENDYPDDPTWQKVRSMRYNAAAVVQVNLPLLDLTIKAGTDVAETAKRIRELDYDKRRESLVVQIANVYYLALSTQRQLQLTEDNLARINELVGIAKAKYEEGEVLETDYTRSEVNRKQIETLRDAYLTALGQQKNLMKFLLNTDRDISLADTDEAFDKHLMADTKADTEATYHGNLSMALPEMQLAASQKEYLDRQIKQIKKAYLPTISLQGQLGAIGYQEKFGHFFHTSEATQNWFGNTYLGLSVKVPIFDANAKKLKIKQARLSYQQAEWREKQVASSLHKEYQDVALALSHSMKTYRTQRESFHLAEDIYRQASERYTEGLASMTELLQDEMALRNAQTQMVQAVYDYKVAELKAMRLSGDLERLYNK